MNKKYLNGIYQAKSSSLFQLETFDTLKNMKNYEVLEYLKNGNYGHGSNYESIDDVISNEYKQLREELNFLTNSSLLGDIYYLDNDLTNIKIAYKSVKYNLPIDDFEKSSKYSIEALTQFFKHDNKDFLDSNDIILLESIKEIDKLNVKEELEEIELHINNYYFDKAKKELPIMVEYLNIKNFIKNLLLFLKLKTRNSDKELLERLLLPQNILDNKEFVYIYEHSNEEVVKRIDLLFYGKLTEGLKQYFETKNINELESNMDLVFKETIQLLSYNHNDIGPLVSYLYLKDDEINNVRRAYYGK